MSKVEKSFTTLGLADGILDGVLSCLIDAEKKAKSSREIQTLEVDRRGLRQDLYVGRLMVIPHQVMDDTSKIPDPLLKGAVLRLFDGEEAMALEAHRLSTNEFDDLSPKDVTEYKDKVFRDDENKLGCVVVFQPAWGNFRDYHAFRWTKDQNKLKTMLRHLVFSAYYNPSLSALFDTLSEEAIKLDAENITHDHLGYAFQFQSEEKSFPVLDKGDNDEPLVKAKKGGLKKRAEQPVESSVMKLSLDEFTAAYLEAAVWTGTDDDGTPLDNEGKFGSDDFSPEALRKAEEDCSAFVQMAGDKIEPMGDRRAGTLFWLNRNGHGTGFWDEDTLSPEVQKELDTLAHSFGECDLYVSDDGELELTGGHIPAPPPAEGSGHVLPVQGSQKIRFASYNLAKIAAAKEAPEETAVLNELDAQLRAKLGSDSNFEKGANTGDAGSVRIPTSEKSGQHGIDGAPETEKVAVSDGSTGLRAQPDYGEADSYTAVMNDANASNNKTRSMLAALLEKTASNEDLHNGYTEMREVIKSDFAGDTRSKETDHKTASIAPVGPTPTVQNRPKEKPKEYASPKRVAPYSPSKEEGKGQTIDKYAAPYSGGLMDTPFYHEQARQRAEAAEAMGIKPGGFVNLYDWYPDIWAEVITAYPGSPELPEHGPFVSYYRYEKDGSPNRQFSGKDSTYGYNIRAYKEDVDPAWGRTVARKDGLWRDGTRVVPPTKKASDKGAASSDKSAYIGSQAATPELLAQAFEKAKSDWMSPGAIFTWTEQDSMAPETETTGSYKHVRPADLEGRDYTLKNVNGLIGIHFNDAKFDPSTKKIVRAADQAISSTANRLVEQHYGEYFTTDSLKALLRNATNDVKAVFSFMTQQGLLVPYGDGQYKIQTRQHGEDTKLGLWNEDEEDENDLCPNCMGPGTELGTLGNRKHFRCRDCGMDFSRKAEKVASAHSKMALTYMHPGQVLEQFYPEVLKDVSNYPQGYAERNYTPPPLPLELRDSPDNAQVTVDDYSDHNMKHPKAEPGLIPSQDSNSVPLKPNEKSIRGPFFSDQFYRVHTDISPALLTMKSSLENKTASSPEKAKIIGEFLRKLSGEIASSLLAAFVMTDRPLFTGSPAYSSINLKDGSTYLPMNPILTSGGMNPYAEQFRALLKSVNDGELADAINDAWAQGGVWHGTEGSTDRWLYEVFVRIESVDIDTLEIRYKYVTGIKE